MKSCPGCLFLIDDSQDLCDTCRTQASAAIPPLQIGSSGGGTAVLDRTAAVASVEDTLNVRYRSSRPVISVKAVAIAVLLALVGGAAASAAGYGPLAPKFAGWGLTFNRHEAFPQAWEHLDDLSAVFEVDLPGGSKSLFEALDPADQGKGGIVGKTVKTVGGAHMQVAWSNFGLNEGELRSYDSVDGLRTLLDRYAAARVSGDMTTSRPVMLPIGQALDAVFADGDVTTRVRMIMTPEEAFILSTSGPDDDSEALDAAHQRLLKSFTPNM